MNRPSTLGSFLLVLILLTLGAPAQQARRQPITPSNRQQIDLIRPGQQRGSAPEVISFTEPAPGTILSEVSADSGLGPIGVHANNPALGPVNAAVVFNSAAPTGGDPDLGTPNTDFDGPGIGTGGGRMSPFANRVPCGNILIVAERLVTDENGLVIDPDDAASGFLTMTFDFSAIAPVTLHSIKVIDIDKPGATGAEFFDQKGGSLGQVTFPAVGNNGVAIVDLGDNGPTPGVFSMVVTLRGSGAIDDIGFEANCVGTIGDFVWNDMDADGIQDPSEPGLENVIVTLFDTNGKLLDTVATSRTGFYEFSGLCAGTYTVEVDTPSPFSPSICDGNGNQDDTVDNDCSGVTVVLKTNTSTDDTIDFGFNAPCSGTIGDFVWNDLDEDGIQDEGEPGLQGLIVELRNEEDLSIQTVTTGPNGFYSFMGLCAGEYTVKVKGNSIPDGFLPTLCNVPSDDTVDNDCGPVLVTLPTDHTQDPTVDFGFFAEPTGRIGDVIWLDLDCDGIQDFTVEVGAEEGVEALVAIEAGIEGVELILEDDMGVILGCTTTDGEGRWEFRGLRPGVYTVRVNMMSLPQAVEPSPCGAGLDPGSDNNCSPATVVLETIIGVNGDAPDFDPTVDFGYRPVPCGGIACTAQFWKDNVELWMVYSPDTLFTEVFENAFPGMTLLEVLCLEGMGLDSLGRQTVAALLNAASNEVDFGLSTGEVRHFFDDVFPGTAPEYVALSDYFLDLNNQICPLEGQ